MIDWDKPIETLTGWPAKVISRDYKTHNETVCLIQIERPAGTSLLGWHRQDGSPFEGDYPIRNVPVKCEGWAVVKHYPERGRFVIIGGDIIQSEAEARKFHMKAIELAGIGCRLVRVVITEREE